MRRLADEYPDARCELDHRNPFELLAATILSAQCTDARVNMVTPTLFAAYPTPEDLAHADPERVEEIIKSTGFYKNKTRSLIGMANAVSERFGGEVPGAMRIWSRSPASVARPRTSCAAWRSTCRGCPVDTHVTRLSHRLGLTTETDAGQDRTRAERHDPGRGAGPVQPAPHPARTPGLRGPQAPVRRLRPGRFLPQRDRLTGSPTEVIAARRITAEPSNIVIAFTESPVSQGKR